jgi:anti-sigma factor RsiW
MTCKDALEQVEDIAAGAVEPAAELRAHVESCTRCAAALASARRLEAMLTSMPVPRAPEHFTAHVVQRLRRENWRAEQRIDRLFNVAIAVGVLLTAGGLAALFNLGAWLPVVDTGWQMVRAALADGARTAAPTLATYVAGAMLFVSAAAMWWWVERRVQF